MSTYRWALLFFVVDYSLQTQDTEDDITPLDIVLQDVSVGRLFDVSIPERSICIYKHYKKDKNNLTLCVTRCTCINREANDIIYDCLADKCCSYC